MTTPFAVLADVCEITMGQAPPGDAYNDNGDGWPLIAGAGDFANGAPSPKKFTSTKTRLSAAGDVILGIRATIGVKVLSDGVYCLGRGVAGLRTKPGLDNRYLWHWLSQARDELAAKGRGATFLQVNRSDISNLLVPLPPIEEQRRIAAVLDKADELRAKRRAALAQLDTLTESIFLDMFSDPLGRGTRNGADAVTTTTLGALATIRTGKLDANAAVTDGAHPFFTCSREALRINQTAFQGKAVLVAGNGDLNVKYYDGPFNAYQRTYVIQSRDESRAHPRFLHGFLDVYVGRLREQSIGGVIKYIRLPNLADAVVNLPSANSQLVYAQRVADVETMRERLQSALTSHDNLFASLQQRAFRGEL